MVVVCVAGHPGSIDGASLLDGFQFPMVGDLINPFLTYSRWMSEQEPAWDGALVPQLPSQQARHWQRTSDGKQVGAISHKAALPPLLSFGLSPDTHFGQALERAQQPTPFEQVPVLDSDLTFAAYVTSTYRGQLHSLRKDIMGRLKELHRRWKPVSSRLRQFQTTDIRCVASRRDLGFLALLVVLMAWGDTSLPRDFLLGMKAVGTAPAYGVFPLQPADDIQLDALFHSVDSHNQHICSQLHPGRDDTFMLTQSMKDADAGFCTQPMTHSQLLRATHGMPFRLIPRCVITQSSGKQRIIDNADVGGQSELSSDPNKLILCSPLRPAQHLSVALALMSESQFHAARRVTPGRAVEKTGRTPIHTTSGGALMTRTSQTGLHPRAQDNGRFVS